MLRSLRLIGYRTFEHFSIAPLSRINLIVGKNSCGKTSILEAVQLLSEGGNPGFLWRHLLKRGEITLTEDGSERDVDPGWLFHKHKIEDGSSFEVRATTNVEEFVKCEITAALDERLPFAGAPSKVLQLSLSSSRLNEATKIPLTSKGGIATDLRRRIVFAEPTGRIRAEFVPTASWDSAPLAAAWEEIVFGGLEEDVINSLQILAPGIERVYFMGPRSSRLSHTGSGVFLRMSGFNTPTPLGSLGDGVRRLFTIVMSMLQVRGGILLVDEIDTGMHYSTLVPLWRLICESAARHDVQVFATTHSWDCLSALAIVLKESESLASDVALFRIEGIRGNAVRYSSDEIITAAQQGIEVR